jgi:hypothetical protein
VSQNLVQSLDASFESINLIPINAALCFIGAMLCVAVMQLSTAQGDLVGESRFGIWSRRFSFGLLGLALMWSCAYSATKGWQPWPPHVFLAFVIDIVLSLRAVQIVARCTQLKNYFKVVEARRRELSMRR